MIRLLPLLAMACAGVDLVAPEPNLADDVEPAPAPVKAKAVQAIVGTSGSDPAVVLDGDLATGWTPEGDAMGEGLLVRFEGSAAVRRVEITPCSDSGVLEVSDYVNGRANASGLQVGGATTLELPAGIDVNTWFVRIDAATGSGCIAELAFGGDSPMAFKPPRRLPALVEASSTLEPEDAYLVEYLFDGRLDFGWVEGADGDGPGEIVTVTLQEAVVLDGIEIWNGYQRSADHFTRNARAKRVRLSTDGGPWTDLDLKDTGDAQRATLLVPMRGKELRVALDASYPGSQYSDLVLSELRFIDRKGPFSVEAGTEVPRVRANKRAQEGKPIADVMDRQLRSLCDGEEAARATFKLRSNNSFVWYEQRTLRDDKEDTTTEREELFDGAWVVDKQDDGWTRIKLYGRRNRTEETWKPYAPAVEGEQVRIAGGTVKIARVGDLGRDEFGAWVKRWADGPLGPQLACVRTPDPEGEPLPLPKLKAALIASGAVIVEGAAMSDVLVPAAGE